MAGKFIVFEGLDMSGKSTQIEILKDFLKLKYPDKKIVFTKEPGSNLNKIAPKIREILLHTEENLSSHTEALLYAADRAHHVDALKNLIADDYIVICDRYFYTSLAYQAYAGTLELNTVLQINDIATQGLVPDLYIHMDIPIEEYINRKSKRDSLDRIEKKDETFFIDAINGYRHMMNDIAKTDYEHLLPKISMSLDATDDISTNSGKIIEIIEDLLLQ